MPLPLSFFLLLMLLLIIFIDTYADYCFSLRHYAFAMPLPHDAIIIIDAASDYAITLDA